MRTDILAGWIDRNGLLHECLDGEHDRLAEKLGFRTKQLDSMLWIRFSSSNRVFQFDRHLPIHIQPTQRQLDKCFDLAVRYNMIEAYNMLIEFFQD